MKYSILLSLLLLISNISLAQLTPNDKAETDLSTTITDQELISVIAESEFDTSLIIIVDFQKWAQKENLYIAVAYFVSDKDRKDNYIKTNKIICDEESERIGIFMLEFKDSLHSIGKYYGSPSSFESDFNAIKYDGLDLDNYNVADDKPAFGLKTRTDAYYSGGSVTYNTLTLFVKDGNELINIFSDCVGESGDLAGEWIINENGETIGRERDMVESWKEIVCLPSKTSGFYDLKVSSSYYDDEIGDHIEDDTILRWDTDLKTYSCAEE